MLLARNPRATGYRITIPIVVNPSILWTIRQAQIKIATSGVSYFWTSWIKEFSSPKIKKWFPASNA
ncbi:MAG: hypothetical protein A3I24_01550 [Candidatus Harrisonbacteria bacterium RIFCSPLOWO2_02_FULL_41_13b]|uniref:Uncharacterized protein n=1 Tax=Candidatus Harrisonbacteria bacterium RIFCSPLOWO2_02_FULL_41_13b TaxID=1798409 RepID=A0A1G1ZTZ5_9BACT|nr:MAG: hypothetical protein A3I24_01550 [Candidatus Harrisonbacteria bacterium RIFCSPLOWO2_02_FULL_41_13b]